jgi:tRNA U55 pseudouridine synthase TruB
MAELRRSRTGAFKEDETLCTLQDLHDAYTLWVDQKDERYLRCLISPMEKAVAHWKKIYIRDSAVDAIAHGASLAVAGVLNLEKSIAVQDPVAIMTQKGELVATGDAVMAADKIIDASHGFCVKTKRVYMQRGMYPTWKKQSDITTSN